MQVGDVRIQAGGQCINGVVQFGLGGRNLLLDRAGDRGQAVELVDGGFQCAGAIGQVQDVDSVGCDIRLQTINQIHQSRNGGQRSTLDRKDRIGRSGVAADQRACLRGSHNGVTHFDLDITLFASTQTDQVQGSQVGQYTICDLIDVVQHHGQTTQAGHTGNGFGGQQLSQRQRQTRVDNEHCAFWNENIAQVGFALFDFDGGDVGQVAVGRQQDFVFDVGKVEDDAFGTDQTTGVDNQHARVGNGTVGILNFEEHGVLASTQIA